MSARRLFALTVLLVACGVAACIIGPKQDDPAEDRGLTDAGAVIDQGTLGGGGGEADPPAGDTAFATPEASTSDTGSDATEVGDAAASDADASDAAPEGG